MKRRRILASLMAILMMVVMFPAMFVSAAETEADYYGTNPAFYPDAAKVDVSWSNPAATGLTKVELYNVSGSEPVLVKGDCSAEPGAGVLVRVEELTADSLQQFKVEFSFSDNHEKTSLLIGGKVSDSFWNDKFALSGTDLKVKPVTGGGNRTVNLNIDRNMGHDSSSSLHFTNNFYDKIGELKLYANTLSHESGQKYVCSMWVKANGFKQIPLFDGGDASWIGQIFGGNINSILEADSLSEWKYIECEATGWDDNEFNLFLAGMPAKDLWIDDIKLCKKGTDTNLIKGGDFESVTDANQATISGAIADGTASITVTPEYDTAWVYIYEEVNGTDVLRAMVDRNITDLSLDGIKGSKLKAVAKSTGAVLSAPFELAGDVEPEIKEEDYYGSVPLFTYTNDAATANVSWRNPAKECSKVSLYDVTNPRAIRLIGDSYSTAAKDIITVPVSGLVPEGKYLYKAVFEFADHSETSLFIGGTAGIFAMYEAILGDCVSKLWISGSAMTQDFDKSVSATADGSGSLHISNNLSALVDGGAIEINNNGIQNGKSYTLKFKMKANEFKQYRSFLGMLGGKAVDYFVPGGSDPGRAVSFDWQEFSFTDTAEGDSTALKQIEHGAQDVWIDDIRIYEGDTLIKEIKFDNIPIAAEVTGAAAQAGEGSVTLNYTVPTGAQAVYIYQQIGDKLIWRANAGTLNSVTIDGLESGTEQTFVIKALSGDHVLSNGVTVTATPSAPKMQTGIYKLYMGDTQITKPEQGDMTVKLDVTNHEMGDGFQPCYIVAVYDGNRMISATVANEEVIKNGETKTLSATVNVGADVKDCKIKAFLWKDFNTMGILKINGEFE